MKKVGMLIAVVMIVSLCCGAYAAERENPRLITVTGEAEIKVVPDEVIVTFGVETNDKEISVSRSKNDERVKNVLALAEKYSINAKPQGFLPAA